MIREMNSDASHDVLGKKEPGSSSRDEQNNNGVACNCMVGDSPLSSNRGRDEDSPLSTRRHSQEEDSVSVFPREAHHPVDGDPGSPKSHGISLEAWKIGPREEAMLLHPAQQIKEEHGASCFPAISPMPLASTICASAAPSFPPLHMGQLHATRFAAASHADHLPLVSTAIFHSSNLKGIGKLHWEERYHHLQIFLRQLEDSEPEDFHMGMLRSLSSAELSRHAVELEKRSIQLSLEEAREVQRVGILNLLGKSSNKC